MADDCRGKELMGGQGWQEERSGRVTPSTFGTICKTRDKQRTAAAIYKKKSSSTKISAVDLYNDFRALREYERLRGRAVEPCGLFIDREYPFLAASPVGVLKDVDTIVDIKCPAGARNVSPFEAEIILQGFFCYDGTLKRQHNYYYQVQGNLHITGYRFCEFVVWTPNGMQIEKIEKDDIFWHETILPKVKDYYFNYFQPLLTTKTSTMEVKRVKFVIAISDCGPLMKSFLFDNIKQWGGVKALCVCSELEKGVTKVYMEVAEPQPTEEIKRKMEEMINDSGIAVSMQPAGNANCVIKAWTLSDWHPLCLNISDKYFSFPCKAYQWVQKTSAFNYNDPFVLENLEHYQYLRDFFNHLQPGQ